MSGGGSDRNGGVGQGNNQNGTGGGSSGGNGPFTWNGAKPSSTFDPKNFGTTLYQDMNTAYKQGPKINPISPFTDYGQQTKDLISGGLGQMAPIANGSWLNGGNPYFEQSLATTRGNTMNALGDEFQSFGRFGGGSMVDTASRAIADSENNARMQNFDTEYNRMLGAQGQGLALSGLLDSKAAEQTAANSTMWDRTNNAPFNHLAQYMGLLRGGDSANETNKPTSIWDILGGVGSVVGSFL